MPNWCSSMYAIYSDNEIELLRIMMMLREADNKAEHGNSREILRALRCPEEICEKMDGRTSMANFGPFYKDKKLRGVLIDTESAWGPCNDFIETLIDKIIPGGGDVEYCYLSEEEGCDVFVNTDTSGEFFETRMRIDYATPDDGIDVLYFGDNDFADCLEFLEDMLGEAAVEDITSYNDFFDEAVLGKIDNAFRVKYADHKEELECNEIFLLIRMFTPD